VLAAYCQAYGRWVEAERRLKETPPLLKTPAGYVQQSPWLSIANKQIELMTRLMAEIGLTPSARSRLAVQVSLRPKPWEMRDAWEA
jgi:P27 family predicted phage terminase small subunit